MLPITEPKQCNSTCWLERRMRCKVLVRCGEGSEETYSSEQGAFVLLHFQDRGHGQDTRPAVAPRWLTTREPTAPAGSSGAPNKALEPTAPMVVCTHSASLVARRLTASVRCHKHEKAMRRT